MERALLVFFFFLCCLSSSAQVPFSRSAGGLGCAGLSSVSLVSCQESVNPASRALCGRLEVVTSCVLPYSMPELCEMLGSATLSTPLANLSARVGRSGGDDSHFTSVGGGVSRLFGGAVALGVEYNFLSHMLPLNQRGLSFYSVVGIALFPSDAWQLSAAIRNVERSVLVYPSRDVSLPTTVWASLTWRAPRYLSAAFEVEKESRHDVVGRVALALRPVRPLFFTMGFSSLGGQMSAGAGYDWRLVGGRASVSYHPALGMSSGAAISFHLGS